jgi:hypothetical protein
VNRRYQLSKLLVGRIAQEGTMDNKIYINGELFVKFEIIKKYMTPVQLSQAGTDDHAEYIRSIQEKVPRIVSVRRQKRYLSSYVGKHRCR